MSQYDPRDDYYSENRAISTPKPFIIDMREKHTAKWTTFLYPDGQRSINITTSPGLNRRTYLIWNGTMEELLLMTNAIESMGLIKDTLVIPYLMGARYDRMMQFGDAFYLKVMANVINSCGFNTVLLLDPHSDVAPALINNNRVYGNGGLVRTYSIPNSVLICPDAGAAKKINKYMEINPNITDVVHCVKYRDPKSGYINLRVLEPGKCLNRPCVIIDDICDGGGTFAAIADQIKPEHLSLIVTHGLFTKGSEPLAKFNTIITTDSFRSKGFLNAIGIYNSISATKLMGEDSWT